VTSTQAQLTEVKTTLSSQLAETNTNLNEVKEMMKTLLALQNKTQGEGPNGNSSTNGSSLPPTDTTTINENSPSSSEPQRSSKNPPYTRERLIEILQPTTVDKPFESQIVTADLEAIITPEGHNVIYMAAWYNGLNEAIFNIKDYGYNTNSMLEQFWLDLIIKNKGRTVYYHNWGGYDSILSMAPLFNLPGYTFEPFVNNGEVMCLTVEFKGTIVLTIKDSMRILPGALGRLAKDWKVETQKEHFPHYFFLNDLKSTMNYIGPIPPYSCFEPKRTSEIEYQAMLEEFKNGWNFLVISKKYILGDVKALYQILIAFFQAIASKFPINPITVLSAPSTAFKIWRTVQLPILNREGLKVMDFSYKNQDSQLRESYLGGIVDVYRPHMQGQGYYYDVNSLYPTAMCKPMPVGMPTLVHYPSITAFETSLRSGEFFGFVQCTVQAPFTSTPAGYIGILPIKLQSRLICPGGTFVGFFFSEELLFALNNGYTLLSIKLAYKFQRGENTFKQLIQKLNEMKIEAQLNNQPTIRNIAKLLMNSMYGRFGMKTENVKHQIVDIQGLEKLMKKYNILGQINLGQQILVSYTLNEVLTTMGSNPKPEFVNVLESMPHNTNVAIAAAVTAYSRIIINQYKLKALEQGLELYYSDTDSLVLNGPLPETLISSTTLGKLKLEYKFKEGIFIMPKVYCLELENGSLITKCKGYPGKLTKDQYLSLLEGNPLSLQVTKWLRSLKDSTIQILRNTPYTINPILNKRNKVIEDGKWVNTKPIILNSLTKK
jgi:hypothetical protein